MLPLHSLRDIPGNSPEAGLLALLVRDQACGKLDDSFLFLLIQDLPVDVDDPLPRSVDLVEDFEGCAAVLFVHEFAEISPLDFLSRKSEDLAESVVEVGEAALKIHFVDAVIDAFYKGLVPFARECRIGTGSSNDLLRPLLCAQGRRSLPPALGFCGHPITSRIFTCVF